MCLSKERLTTIVSSLILKLLLLSKSMYRLAIFSSKALYASLFLVTVLHAELVDFKTLTSVNHDQFIETFQGKDVEMKGFLYVDDDGNYLLAPQPNLRSCCLKAGSEQKALKVEGMGLFPLVGTKVTLKGVLYSDPKNENADIFLLAAFPSEDNDGQYVVFVMCLLALFLISWMVYWIWSNKKS